MTYKAKKKKNLLPKIFAWILVFAMVASFVGMLLFYIFGT